MFHANRWATVFIDTLNNDIDEGFAFLKVITEPFKAVSGILYGYNISRQIEIILRDCVNHTRGVVNEKHNQIQSSIEYSIRFITLLIEKNQFKHIDVILAKIEERINERNGVLTVIIETAFPMDSVFETEIKQRIAQDLGTAKLFMKTQVNPELLGGYCLRIGGFFIDASLKKQIENMRTALEVTV